MEPLSSYAMLAAQLAVGGTATVMMARVFPLWLLVRAAQHGRYAGLGEPKPNDRPGAPSGPRLG